MSDAMFVGVDPSREIIEASVRPTGERLTADANEDGRTEITEKLSDLQPQLIVMQANGNYELPLAGLMATAGLPFALIHPWSIREFARAIGRITRSEHRHAGLLAQFAELTQPDPWQISDDLIHQLRDLRERRSELLQMMVLERNRAESAASIVRKDIQHHVEFLERSLRGIDQQFSYQIRMSRIWR